MTEVIVGMTQLLNLLKKEGIVYKKTDPDNDDPNYGIIETEKAIMTFRRVE